MNQHHSETTGKTNAQPTPHAPSPTMAQWDVVLHRDDDNTIGETILALIEVTPLPLKDAAERTMSAHRDGRAKLVTTHLERAELYRLQLSSRNLHVTLERAE